MNPAIEALFDHYRRVAGDDKTAAAILTLANILAAVETETARVSAVDGRLLSVAQAGNRLSLSSRLIYQKCLTGELRPIRIDRTIYVPVSEIERYEARQ